MNTLMNKRLFVLVLMIGASICVCGCNKNGTEQAKADSQKKEDANDPPKKQNENKTGAEQAKADSKKDKDANNSNPPEKQNLNKGNIANAQTPQEEPGKKESKDEPLYQGKPAAFWLKQLKDKDAAFRLEAVKALGEIGADGEGVVLALVKTLADKNQKVKDAAREAITSLPLESRIPALVQILRGKDKSVFPAAIALLGKAGSKAKDAIPDLTRALMEEDAAIRLEAIKTLGTIGKQNDKVLSAILVACSDPDEGVSQAARGVMSSVDVKNRVAILAQSLKTADNKTRLVALQFLVEVGADAKEAVPAIVEMLKMDEEDIRIQAAKMLSKVGKDAGPASPELIHLLADKSAQVRLEAANALKAIPIGNKLPALVAALKDKNAEIRAYAVGELQEVGPDAKSAVPALVSLLQDKAVRISATKALGKIGPDARDAIASLAKMLDDDDNAVRTTALAALGNLGPEARVAVLIGLLRDMQEGIRQQAAAEIARFGPQAKMAIPALARTLDDQNPMVCGEAAMALKAMGKDGVQPLMEFLKSKNKNRAFAVRALGEIGPDAKAAIPVLGKLLDDEDQALQSAATAALRNMGPEGRLLSLIGSLKGDSGSLKSDNPNVRAEAWNVRARAARELGAMRAGATSAIPALVAGFEKYHKFHQENDVPEAWAYAIALKRIGAHDVPLLIETLKKNKDNPLLVALLASTLAEIGLPDARAAVPVLAELLQDKKCQVSAALALAQMDGSEAKVIIPVLLDILRGEDGFEGHESYLAAKVKAEAFARRKDEREGKIRPRLPRPGEVKEIQRFGLADSQKEIKAEGREWRLDPNALISERNNKRVRLSAVVALKAMGKDAIPPLMQILKSDGKRQALAAMVLVEMFPDEAREAISIFVQLRGNAKTHTAVYAYALGMLGGPEARKIIPDLVDLLGDGDELVQEAAAAAIKNIGKDAVPLLIEFLNDKGRRRILALGALGEIGPDARAATPILLKLLRDDDCAEAASLALGRIGGPDARPAISILAKVLEEGDEHMQRAAAAALGTVGKDAVPTLLKILKDWDKDAGGRDHRFLAVYALGEIGPDARAAIPVLVGLLNDEDDVLRMTAATALGKLGKDAAAPLIEFLKGENPQRMLAVHALGQIGPDSSTAIPILLELLQKNENRFDDLQKQVAKEAQDGRQLRRFVFLNPNLLKLKTFDVLLEADSSMRFSTALALAKIGGPEARAAIPVLIGRLHSELRARKLPEAELKKAASAREKGKVSGIGTVLKALRQEHVTEDESRNEDWSSNSLQERAAKDLLLEKAAIRALQAIGKEGAASLIESLKKRGMLPTAIALARISPEAANGLDVAVIQRDRAFGRSIDPWNSQVTDAELREIAPFKALSGLSLDRTRVTDAGMKVLSNFKKLSKLSLDSTPITNAGLKEIARLDGLRMLEIGGTRVTDAGLKEIAKLKNLSLLDLGGTKITDAGLDELGRIESLSSLGLAFTDITDAGLKRLASFKNLSLIDLSNTQVTDAGVADLRKALPRVTIIR